MDESEDRRARKTKQHILAAGLSLIAERGWDKTTVLDIAERADIGRSTFYAHYATKEDLITTGLASMVDQFEGRGLALGHAWILHLDQNRVAIRNALRADGHAKVLELIQQVLTQRMSQQLSDRSDGDRFLIDAQANYEVGALIGLVKWWVETDFPYTADELYDLYLRLASARQTAIDF